MLKESMPAVVHQDESMLTITLPVLESFQSSRVGIEQAAVATEHEGV